MYHDLLIYILKEKQIIDAFILFPMLEFFKIYSMCISVLPECLFVYPMHSVPVEARKGC